jgi:hypothetical protein
MLSAPKLMAPPQFICIGLEANQYQGQEQWYDN